MHCRKPVRDIGARIKELEEQGLPQEELRDRLDAWFAEAARLTGQHWLLEPPTGPPPIAKPDWSVTYFSMVLRLKQPPTPPEPVPAG
jgi:hypothetical protein